MSGFIQNLKPGDVMGYSQTENNVRNVHISEILATIPAIQGLLALSPTEGDVLVFSEGAWKVQNLDEVVQRKIEASRAGTLTIRVLEDA